MTVVIKPNPPGDVSRDSSNVVADYAENDQSLSMAKEVSSSDNTTGVPVSTVPSDSVDIPVIATLKVQCVRQVMDEDTIKPLEKKKVVS